jgi:hypothetical protein
LVYYLKNKEVDLQSRHRFTELLTPRLLILWTKRENTRTLVVGTTHIRKSTPSFLSGATNLFRCLSVVLNILSLCLVSRESTSVFRVWGSSLKTLSLLEM